MLTIVSINLCLLPCVAREVPVQMMRAWLSFASPCTVDTRDPETLQMLQPAAAIVQRFFCHHAILSSQ